MAIKKVHLEEALRGKEGEYIGLKIDNGDFKALSKIVDTLDFKDLESALRFAVAVLVKGGEEGVYVDEEGNKVKLLPGDGLLKAKAEDQE